MSDKVPLTLAGKIALEEEMRKLKTEDRPAVVQAIAEARELGDLSENAEYAAAREKQGFIEGRIQQISDIIARAEVIDPASLRSDKVVFGATVKLLDESGKTLVYHIVGEPEADLSKGKVSITSPLARALIGKKAGDDAVVKSPKGDITYEIAHIQFG